MKQFFLMILLSTLLIIPPAFAADAKGVNFKPSTPEEWRTYLRYRRDEALEDLYHIKPEAKDVISKAHGYAVFTNFSMKILFVGSGKGRGLVHDNKTGQETFMQMFQAGVGLGLGVKDFRAIFVFDDRQVMEDFINSGWSFGGEADAAAKNEETGDATSGAIAVAPGVRVYQLTENGLAVNAMVNGTKYWVDKNVN
ncbi:MAG: YSC84-related protein [Candidatus Omnitrophica bacterium]|nr:YSC84-related protein [Candidatus Omnitrophota bacterium]